MKARIQSELDALKAEGRSKAAERIVSGCILAKGEKGPRFILEGSSKEYIRMNSNDYLGLSLHPSLAAAAHKATSELGTNAGGVRFICGTTRYHTALEAKLARFHGMDAAKVFSCAYMANLGIALAIMTPETYVISDRLNHNSIVRALKIAGVAGENKAIFAHNDRADLAEKLEKVPEGMKRVVIYFDGIFSMRGDYSPLKEISGLAQKYSSRFEEGVITIIDDSHGTAAYGRTGRGTPEVAGGRADVIVSTLGKAFGAEGGYIASSTEVIELVRQRSDTYIYTNPIAPGGAAAAIASIGIVDSDEGIRLLEKAKSNAMYFRQRLSEKGYEMIPGVHPIIPIMLRDTDKVKSLVSRLFEAGVLVTGITYPIVPKGDECIRLQLSASHTRHDLDQVLEIF